MRTNETPSLGTVEQELVHFDPGQGALPYAIRALQPTFTALRNDSELQALGPHRCRLRGKAVFVLARQAERMRKKPNGKMGVMLEVSAKAFAERMRQGEDAAAP